MITLRIEHPVADYAAWKQAFDSDPVGRERSGVRRYQILKAVDDSNDVMIDLEFDSVERAEALLAKMRIVWSQVQGTLISTPRARIAQAVETVELTRST